MLCIHHSRWPGLVNFFLASHAVQVPSKTNTVWIKPLLPISRHRIEFYQRRLNSGEFSGNLRQKYELVRAETHYCPALWCCRLHYNGTLHILHSLQNTGAPR